MLPAQSYLSNVAGAIEVCTTEACLDQYWELEASFASGNAAGYPCSQFPENRYLLPQVPEE